jgi:hypothetical protein
MIVDILEMTNKNKQEEESKKKKKEPRFQLFAESLSCNDANSRNYGNMPCDHME